MRLIPFHLHPTFSRLARTVVLALCLFDTIVAAQPALPTGQEPDQPEIIVDNLRLLRWQRADDDTKGERILCLDFETLIEQICSPFSSAKQWNQIQTVELGKAYFLNPTYVEETLGHLRKALAKCRLWEGDPEQEIWKCFDGLVDILSKSISGLRMPYHYIVSDATMEIWHGYNLQPVLLRVLRYETRRKQKTGNFKVQIDGNDLEFTITKTGPKESSSSVRLMSEVFSGYVYLDKATLTEVILNGYQSAVEWNEVPVWVRTVAAEQNLKKEPKYSMALVRVDKFLAEMEGKAVRQEKYLHGWEAARAEELTSIVRQKEKNKTEREVGKAGKGQPGPSH